MKKYQIFKGPVNNETHFTCQEGPFQQFWIYRESLLLSITVPNILPNITGM